MMRLTVPWAPVVCSVPNTTWPVSAAVIAASIVSKSRISPTRITSGSCRNARRRRKGAKGSPNGALPDGSAPEVARSADRDGLEAQDGKGGRDGQEAHRRARAIPDSQEHDAEEALNRAAE